MHLKIFFTVFFTVLCAELGDKTQLATLLFAVDQKNSKLMIFLGSSLALVLASLVAIMLGNTISKFVEPKYLSLTAGSSFIVLGVITIIKALKV